MGISTLTIQRTACSVKRFPKNEHHFALADKVWISRSGLERSEGGHQGECGAHILLRDIGGCDPIEQ